MRHDPIVSGQREAVQLPLDTGVVAAAREAGIDLSQLCEAALLKAAADERNRRWREDNREAIEGWNAWYRENGHPLAHLINP